jgi:hypothetical protein
MDLRVIDIKPETIRALKILAINSGKTLRQYVIDLLTKHTESK